MNYIKSFANKDTKRIYQGKFVKRFPSYLARKAQIKLIMIDHATNINVLRSPPSNHLEKLEGDRQGQYSIAINSQWRICFMYQNNNFYHVEIVDYH
ncbi:type II toxin-antitoxin system RelE/ParE family toxin [Lactobacillus hamsteri]|nr:type II toxin-antitoxin system RelE/ParE family toxin [Lactobacillus hamsteri]